MSHSSAGSAIAMIWQSSSCSSARVLWRPWPPTPMTATFTLSLGATKRGPPSTCRGTMVAAAAEAVVAMKRRRLGAGMYSWAFLGGGSGHPEYYDGAVLDERARGSTAPGGVIRSGKACSPGNAAGS